MERKLEQTTIEKTIVNDNDDQTVETMQEGINDENLLVDIEDVLESGDVFSVLKAKIDAKIKELKEQEN